jgi:hypothetical protein
MLELDLHPGGTESYEDALAENVSLRLLLAQAEINTRDLLAKAGIDARERETSDKLQKLMSISNGRSTSRRNVCTSPGPRGMVR